MAETPVRHIRIDDETWNALVRIGEEDERTPGFMVRRAVEELIERSRAAKRAAKQAAFDADLDKPIERKSGKK
jgi:predicted transcriptional regulator